MTAGRPEAGPDPGATLASALVAIAGAVPVEDVLALGWSTVELDRAEAGFRVAFGDTLIGVTDAPGDGLLGASCRIVRTGDARVPVIVLLEPATEGRLAASLARLGEGPVAAWLRLRAERALPSRRSVATPGPFGPEVLVLGGPVVGPHRLLVRSEPGTISS